MLEAAGALETIAESNQLFSTVSMLVQLSNQPHKVSFRDCVIFAFISNNDIWRHFTLRFISNLLNNDKY